MSATLKQQFSKAKTYEVTVVSRGSRATVTVKAYNRGEARGRAKRLLGMSPKRRLPQGTIIQEVRED